MTHDKNWPQLSAVRIDEMARMATSQPQETQSVVVFWRRPVMALVASLVLFIAVAVSWSLPRYPATPIQENTIAASDAELSDYLMYEVLDDLT